MQIRSSKTAVFYGAGGAEDGEVSSDGAASTSAPSSRPPSPSSLVLPALRALQDGRFADARQASGVLGSAISHIADTLEDNATTRLRRNASLSSTVSSIGMSAIAIAEMPQTGIPQTTLDALSAHLAEVQTIAEKAHSVATEAARLRDDHSATAPLQEATQHLAATGGHSEAIDRGLAELSGVAEMIASLARTIADLSSSTNLLALNAAIEAAKAGEAGRGFGAVIHQVKELAHRTGKASEGITDATNGLVDGIGTIKTALAASRAATDSGNECVRAATTRFAGLESRLGQFAEQSCALQDVLDSHNRSAAELKAMPMRSETEKNARHELIRLAQKIKRAHGLVGESFAEMRSLDLSIMPLEHARAGHMACLTRIAQVMAGTEDASALDAISPVARCTLSHWLANEVNTEQLSNQMRAELASRHERVHSLRDIMIAALRAGAAAAAGDALKQLEFETLALCETLELASVEIEQAGLEARRPALLAHG